MYESSSPENLQPIDDTGYADTTAYSNIPESTGDVLDDEDAYLTNDDSEGAADLDPADAEYPSPEDLRHLQGIEGEEVEVSGEENAPMFAVRMPNATAEQIDALQSLAARFGWELMPAEIYEATDAESPTTTDAAIEATPDPEDPEPVAYMKKYINIKDTLDKVADLGYNFATPPREAFTAEEQDIFRRAGYKSVVYLTNTFGSEQVTVYAYEDVPGLPAFKVTALRSALGKQKNQPMVLQTFTFGASGGRHVWQQYTSKLFGRMELQPPAEGNDAPMEHYHLDRLRSVLSDGSKPLERVRNGTWQNNGEQTVG